LPDSRLAPPRGTQKPAARDLSWPDCTLTRLTFQVRPATSDPVDSESDPRLPAIGHLHAARDGPAHVTTCGLRRSNPRGQHSSTVNAPPPRVWPPAVKNRLPGACDPLGPGRPIMLKHAKQRDKQREEPTRHTQKERCTVRGGRGIKGATMTATPVAPHPSQQQEIPTSRPMNRLARNPRSRKPPKKRGVPRRSTTTERTEEDRQGDERDERNALPCMHQAQGRDRAGQAGEIPPAEDCTPAFPTKGRNAVEPQRTPIDLGSMRDPPRTEGFPHAHAVHIRSSPQLRHRPGD
jgi:hypothetical protein